MIRRKENWGVRQTTRTTTEFWMNEHVEMKSLFSLISTPKVLQKRLRSYVSFFGLDLPLHVKSCVHVG